MTLLSMGAMCFFLGLFFTIKAWGEAEPHTLSCHEFYAQGSDRDWLALTDCELALPAAIQLMDGDRVAAIYVPLYPPVETPIHLVLKTSDAELIRVAQELDEARKTMDEATWYGVIEADIERAMPVRDVDGLVISAHSADNRNALELLQGLGDDPTVLKHGSSPSPGLGWLLLGIGVVTLAGAGARAKAVA